MERDYPNGSGPKNEINHSMRPSSVWVTPEWTVFSLTTDLDSWKELTVTNILLFISIEEWVINNESWLFISFSLMDLMFQDQMWPEKDLITIFPVHFIFTGGSNPLQITRTLRSVQKFIYFRKMIMVFSIIDIGDLEIISKSIQKFIWKLTNIQKTN